MLRNAKVAAAIAQGKADQLAKADLSAVRALEELRRIAFSDMAACFDGDGNLLPLSEMPPEAQHGRRVG